MPDLSFTSGDRSEAIPTAEFRLPTAGGNLLRGNYEALSPAGLTTLLRLSQDFH